MWFLPTALSAQALPSTAERIIPASTLAQQLLHEQLLRCRLVIYAFAVPEQGLNAGRIGAEAAGRGR
jgi:hypothetical protein